MIDRKGQMFRVYIVFKWSWYPIKFDIKGVKVFFSCSPFIQEILEIGICKPFFPFINSLFLTSHKKPTVVANYDFIWVGRNLEIKELDMMVGPKKWCAERKIIVDKRFAIFRKKV